VNPANWKSVNFIGEGFSPMTILFVLQRVESASLLIDNKDKYIDINKGIIIHISILKETKKEDLDKVGNSNLK
jgi:D-Tyr-tRNAtyr deacylase